MTPQEIRPASVEAVRAEDSSMTLRGTAALYNTETTIGGMFREAIAPGAFDEAVTRDDVRALWNHDPNVVLGRTVSGTLALTTTADGLHYEVQLNPADPDHVRVWQMVSRGDVSQSSFGFAVTGQEWREKEEGKLPLRVITKTTLYDVSPVTYPAYTQTTVTARDLPGAQDEAPAVVEAAIAAQRRQSLVEVKRLRLHLSDID